MNRNNKKMDSRSGRPLPYQASDEVETINPSWIMRKPTDNRSTPTYQSSASSDPGNSNGPRFGDLPFGPVEQIADENPPLPDDFSQLPNKSQEAPVPILAWKSPFHVPAERSSAHHRQLQQHQQAAGYHSSTSIHGQIQRHVTNGNGYSEVDIGMVGSAAGGAASKKQDLPQVARDNLHWLDPELRGTSTVSESSQSVSGRGTSYSGAGSFSRGASSVVSGPSTSITSPTPSEWSAPASWRSSNNAPYFCLHPDCTIPQTAFSTRAALKKHQKKYMPYHLRPFVCRRCGKRFYENKDLGRHVEDAHGSEDRPHGCEQCGRGFKRKDHLKKHSCKP